MLHFIHQRWSWPRQAAAEKMHRIANVWPRAATKVCPRTAAAVTSRPSPPASTPRSCCTPRAAAASCSALRLRCIVLRIGEVLFALLHVAADAPDDELQCRCPPDAEIAALRPAQHRFLPAHARCDMDVTFWQTLSATAFACLLGPCLRSCLRSCLLHRRQASRYSTGICEARRQASRYPPL